MSVYGLLFHSENIANFLPKIYHQTVVDRDETVIHTETMTNDIPAKINDAVN
jgi:DNA-binding transcriptional regulator of glucitol operon